MNAAQAITIRIDNDSTMIVEKQKNCMLVIALTTQEEFFFLTKMSYDANHYSNWTKSSSKCNNGNNECF